MKEVRLMFYAVNPSPENVGLKHVLFEIVDGEGQAAHDWGFAYWAGAEWEEVEVPKDFTCKVIRWANTVNPEVLLKEPSKIIKLS